MARIERDGFHGGHRVTGLEHDVREARQSAQYRQDMGRISSQLADAPGDALAGAARTTAGMALGGAAVGVGMVRSRRFRYLVQAVLHFPMAFAVVFGAALLRGMPDLSAMSGDDQIAQWIAGRLLVTLIGAAVWTALYVVLRTLPKLRALRGRF